MAHFDHHNTLSQVTLVSFRVWEVRAPLPQTLVSPVTSLSWKSPSYNVLCSSSTKLQIRLAVILTKYIQLQTYLVLEDSFSSVSLNRFEEL